jgi:hypothetical protein
MPPTTRSSRVVKTPLSEVEFDSASDVIKYGDLLQKTGRTEQLELHTAADELQAVLSASTGNVFERAAARRKAKKVSNILRAAAESARAMSVDGVRLKRGFKREYAELIDPPKKPRGKSMDWKG